MSVDWGRPEVAGEASTDANDPEADMRIEPKSILNHVSRAELIRHN
jgi:hypothetical protein